MVGIMAVILGVNFVRAPSWAALAQALSLLLIVGIVTGGMVLLVRRQTRHQAEAAEFERILERAAWPPSSSASPQVAV
jgi:hypothetical protein